MACCTPRLLLSLIESTHSYPIRFSLNPVAVATLNFIIGGRSGAGVRSGNRTYPRDTPSHGGQLLLS
jgi:hypothetical protein